MPGKANERESKTEKPGRRPDAVVLVEAHRIRYYEKEKNASSEKNEKAEKGVWDAWASKEKQNENENLDLYKVFRYFMLVAGLWVVLDKKGDEYLDDEAGLDGRAILQKICCYLRR